MGPAGGSYKTSFEAICDIGNIFLMRPENLRSYLQEGLLGQLDPKFTLQFVAQRADFKTAKLDGMFPEIQTSSLASFFALTSADL